jgi:hypothetical protein
VADHVSRPHQQGRVGDLRQQTTSARTYGRSRQDVWQTTCQQHTCGRPRQQGHVADHDNDKCQVEDHFKYTWHNQMMTCVKRKLAHAMSTSDVNKLRHSGRITSGVSPLANDKSSEVPKDEIPK